VFAGRITCGTRRENKKRGGKPKKRVKEKGDLGGVRTGHALSKHEEKDWEVGRWKNSDCPKVLGEWGFPGEGAIPMGYREG